MFFFRMNWRESMEIKVWKEKRVSLGDFMTHVLVELKDLLANQACQ